jgi:hypothetical protein
MSARLLLLLASTTSALALIACGGDEPREEAGDGATAPMHVHGLGVNPADGALFVATHTGLFRVDEGDGTATRVGDRHHDLMGFTVAGRDHFLASGHPGALDDLPPFLGLIESRDGGESWRPVSLVGEVDFHVLESSKDTIYGYGSDWETREVVFLRSGDGGQSWERLDPPGEAISVAISPDGEDLVLSTPEALHRSDSRGERWSRVRGPAGLLAWTAEDRLVSIDAGGRIFTRGSAQSRWREGVGVGGQPVAVEAVDEGLYVALHDGAVLRSLDGREWETVLPPGWG